MLNDEDWEIRCQVTYIFGKAGNEQAVESLIMALNDGNRHMRGAAGDALEKITGKDFGEDCKKWKEWYEKNKGK